MEKIITVIYARRHNNQKISYDILTTQIDPQMLWNQKIQLYAEVLNSYDNMEKDACMGN